MMPILKVENLSKDFVKSLDLVAKGLNKIGQNYKEEIVHAVDSVNFSIFKGEIVGVVGESGCGKSTLGRMVAGILQPTEGRVEFDTGQVKNKEIPDALLTQMIFQDPFSSLNPRKRVIDIITEAPLYHKLITKSEKRAFAAEMLQRVGLDPDTLERYPHQFSGGQRQRVGIARALAVSPEFLVCDESIAALDVSIQPGLKHQVRQLTHHKLKILVIQRAPVQCQPVVFVRQKTDGGNALMYQGQDQLAAASLLQMHASRIWLSTCGRGVLL